MIFLFKFIVLSNLIYEKIILFLLINAVYQLHAQDKSIYQNVESVVDETQKIISIKKGTKIDTAYFKTLFLPTAHFTVVGKENGNIPTELWLFNNL